jgi:hypothetical protein
MLDIWPELPIDIYAHSSASRLPGVANVIAALKQHTRQVRDINISGIPNSLLETFVSMKKFPSLVVLLLSSHDENVLVLPDDESLHRSVPCPSLQELWLDGIPFPTLPKLLKSPPDLVFLRHLNIPRSGYIPLDAMVESLFILHQLRTVILESRYPQSQLDRNGRRLPLRSHVPLSLLSATLDSKAIASI